MKGGKRQLSQWNLFVQKVYKEGKAKDSNYEFKQALSDASKRKSEMGSMKSSSGRGSMKSRKVSRKSRGKRSMAGGKSRKNRKH
jgi:hypothetical protein